MVDIAMAQFSYGQMENTALKNEMLPVAGGFDEEGKLSCDPKIIGKTKRVLPIGYWKGSALSLVLDLIAAALSGGNSVLNIGKLGADEYALSQVFIALDAHRIGGEMMDKMIAEVIDNLHQSEQVNPKEAVIYPGERSQKTRNKNLQEGIPVDDAVWAKILAL